MRNENQGGTMKRRLLLSALSVYGIYSMACAQALPAEASPVAIDHAHKPLGGCPIVILAGMKVFEDQNGNPIPHPGQWFTATYPGGVCGSSEVGTVWTATRTDGAKYTSDVCYGAADYLATQGAGNKRCGRDAGKIFYVAEPGTYDVTASAPGGIGQATLYGFVVD